MTLYLLRHAESRAWADVPEEIWPLTPRGHAQSQALVPQLTTFGIDVVYTSPYRRARATARPFVEQAGVPMHVEDSLRERKLSTEWLSDHEAAVRRTWNDFTYALPGGESCADSQQRMVAAINRIAARHLGQTVLVSSHGNALGLYLNHLDPSFGFDAWQAMQRPDLFRVEAAGSTASWTRMALFD